MIDLNGLPHTAFIISNRSGVSLFVRLNGSGNQPLALVAHGLSDVHDSAHMRAIASGLVLAGFDVVTYDASNSWGRSGGSIEYATLSAAYDDLCDVYAWMISQPWFKGAVVLAGHSLGGAAAIRFAADGPTRVQRLVLVSPVVSGRLLSQRLNPVIRTLWWFLGRLPELSHKGKWYRYDLLHDGLKYDGVKLAGRLTMPTTIIAPARDLLIPIDQQKLLYAALPEGSGSLNIISGANHTFSGHLEELITEVTTASLRR